MSDEQQTPGNVESPNSPSSSATTPPSAPAPETSGGEATVESTASAPAGSPLARFAARRGGPGPASNAPPQRSSGGGSGGGKSRKPLPRISSTQAGLTGAPKRGARPGEGEGEGESGSTDVARAAAGAASAAAKKAEAALQANEDPQWLSELRQTTRRSDLQDELDAALEGFSVEDLLGGTGRAKTSEPAGVELDQRCLGRVIKCDRESVFFHLGGPQQGVASLRQFEDQLPQIGAQLEVVPVRYLVDDDLYEVVVPGASIQVQDWSDLTEGAVVEARITGHNKGGLECEVNHIRGFIPASQVSLYRVEDLSTFVGQTLQAVVTEANQDRRNLVLSHRAILERDKEQAKEKLLAELAVGQTREAVVRRLQPFGAFVDLGGVDGLIPIGQLSWERIKHPKEVLEEGQRVKVRIERIDEVTGKIGLSYRDLLYDPWREADKNYVVGSLHDGTVTKIMEFGAFVKLAPGVEGLVHISELAHHRVSNPHSVVQEGQTVRVKILSLDKEAQRISLSMKAAQAVAAEAETVEDEPAPTARVVRPSNQPLQGGLNRRSDGDKFGLKW